VEGFRVVLDDLQLDARKTRADLLEERKRKRECKTRRHAECHSTAWVALGCRHVVSHLLEVAQDERRTVQQHKACFSGGGSPRMPLKELNTEFFFKKPDLAT